MPLELLDVASEKAESITTEAIKNSSIKIRLMKNKMYLFCIYINEVMKNADNVPPLF